MDQTATPLLTPAEAATRLGVSSRTLSRWAKDGLIDSVRLPTGHLRIPAGAVEAIRTGDES